MFVRSIKQIITLINKGISSIYLKVHECRFENLSICVFFKKKQDSENFESLVLRILKLFAREVCKILKK